MKQKIQSLYGNNQYENATALINKSTLTKENKKLIIDFANNCTARGLTKTRTTKYLYHLRKIALQINKPLNEVTRKDIEILINWLNSSKYSPWTQADFRIAIKVFYKWLEAEKLGLTIKEIEMQRKEPALITWFSSRVKKTSQKMPEQLLTEEEILSLIKSAQNIRDKAFIATLYESGARISEIGTLKIKNLAFDQYGIKATLFGKTGSRTIRLISATKYLTDWINQHPNKTEQESYVWTGQESKERLNYTSFSDILKIAKKRAGITKPINPHHFRHSRATILAKKLTEQQLKQYMGWASASEMASVYVHLSGRDSDEAILELYGLKEKTEVTV
jgi:site-specific recombinase XerD